MAPEVLRTWTTRPRVCVKGNRVTSPTELRSSSDLVSLAVITLSQTEKVVACRIDQDMLRALQKGRQYVRGLTRRIDDLATVGISAKPANELRET